jgi:NAD(P)-dependent dehydrogenase (short-subunit alcohol dehydrogenase family)
LKHLLTRKRGAAGIGLETTVYLAQKGATVYVASRNPEKSEAGIATARERLGGKGGEIKFHQLQLSDVKSAEASAKSFMEKETRLDILICNAGISMATLKELSPDGYEQMFATNHLGHFAFVNGLLGRSRDLEWGKLPIG